MKTITKETFFQFLKDNNFYNEWIEAYNLDNEIYEDEVPLEKFFEKVKDKDMWFYDGIGEIAYHPRETTCEPLFDLRNRWIDWRDKNLLKCMELDKKWMDFVNTHKDENTTH